MTAASWKGSVQFGPLLAIPVKAVAADKETKFAFNQHHDGCGGRLKMQPGECADCGSIVEKDQIVRGFNGAWPVDEEYVKSLEAEKSQVMELSKLVPASQIEPRWYRRSYELEAEKGSEKMYDLLRELLDRSGRVAQGKVVMSGKEFQVVLRPRGRAIAMELLWWPEELKAFDHGELDGVEVSEKELDMGMKLVEYMAGDFDASELTNEYAVEMETYLAALTAGTAPQPIVKREPIAAAKSLEDALASSVAMFEKKDKPAKKSKKVA